MRKINKYPNRRLYDTEISHYITLDEIKKLVLERAAFVVIDTKTKQDITNTILLQVITELEASGSPIFTKEILQNIIRFYGNVLQGTMTQYLERGIDVFVTQQEELKKNMESLLATGTPLQAISALAQQNMALWEASLKPFLNVGNVTTTPSESSEKDSSKPKKPKHSSE